MRYLCFLTLSSTPEILFSMFCTMLVKINFEVFIWLSEFFISGFISVRVFFSDLISSLNSIFLVKCFHYFIQLSVFLQNSLMDLLRSLNIFIIDILKSLSCSSAKLHFFRTFSSSILSWVLMLVFYHWCVGS